MRSKSEDKYLVNTKMICGENVFHFQKQKGIFDAEMIEKNSLLSTAPSTPPTLLPHSILF